jgi:hypothetical protein
MPEWIVSALISAGSVLLTLTVTLIFNKVVGLPKILKKRKDQDDSERDQLKQENLIRDQKIAQIEADNKSRRAEVEAQRDQLQKTDQAILDTCTKIQEGLVDINQRLDHLEKREKNALRAKILTDYRLFTNKEKNPQLAWSEMEHHSFFELIRDYEDLDGNDYVHSEVIPAMNKLEVIPMDGSYRLEKLYQTRHF